MLNSIRCAPSVCLECTNTGGLLLVDLIVCMNSFYEHKQTCAEGFGFILGERIPSVPLVFYTKALLLLPLIDLIDFDTFVIGNTVTVLGSKEGGLGLNVVDRGVVESPVVFG